MFSLYKLQAKAWATNPFSKMEFVTSILFLVVLSSISVSNENNADTISLINLNIISQITVLTVMNGALYSFGFLFYEMKQSVLLKRIGATQISKTQAIISFILWGLTMIVFDVLWIALWVIIGSSIPNGKLGNILWVDISYAGQIDWLPVFLGLIFTGIAYLPIAFLLISISKNAEMYNIIATFYYFFFGFLGGQIISASNHEWMNVIGFLSPMGWTTNLVTLGLAGNALDVDVSWFKPLGDDPALSENLAKLNMSGNWTSIGILQIVLPLTFGLAAGIATLKTFKWDK